MTNNELINKIQGIPSGRFFRVTYKTEPKLSAMAKNSGVEIIKITEKTVRTGVEYGHINGVTPAGSENKWAHDVIPNKIVKHNTKDSYYLNVAPIKHGGNAKVTWLVNGCLCTEQEIKDSGYIQNSYWKNSTPPVQLIDLNNILEVK